MTYLGQKYDNIRFYRLVLSLGKAGEAVYNGILTVFQRGFSKVDPI